MIILKRLIGMLCVVFGYFILRDVMTATEVFGVVFISLGVLIMMLNSSDDVFSNWLLGRKNKPMFGEDKIEENK